MKVSPHGKYRDTFKKKIYESAVSFDPDRPNDFPDYLEINCIQEVKDLEEKVHNIVIELCRENPSIESKIEAKGVNWRARLQKKRDWLEYLPSEPFHHMLDYFEFPKDRLSHQVFWEDNTDFILWERYLQQTFPLGLFLIGSRFTGFNLASRCLRENQPLFVFNKTGGSASIVSQAIQFMKDQNEPYSRPKDISYFPKKELLFCEPERAHYRNAEQYYKIQKDARVLLQNWPDYFNSDAVLVVDTLDKSIDELQDNITKTMNAVFEELPELGSQREDRKRLKYAWRLHKRLKYNAKRLGFVSGLYVGMLAFLTFVTTMVNIFSGLPEYKTIEALTITSVVLPVVTGVVITMIFSNRSKSGLYVKLGRV